MSVRIISYCLFAAVVLISCRKDVEISPLFKQPDHFPQPHFKFDNFDLTQNRIDLGKKLFYDPALSSDNTISCASCHHKSAGFSDPGNALSLGVNDSLSLRNSPGLANLAWNTSFFWDGGGNHLEVVPFAPITNPKEMNQDLLDLLQELNAEPTYRDLFYDAFGEDTITDQKMFWALAAYMSILISADSKYDRVLNGKETFSADEEQGYALFKSHCAACHTEPLTTNFSFQNNGLDSIFNDTGRERITLNPGDKGKFKVPSLRNVALSAPYMHDGRFANLEQVLDHYSEGIVQSPTINNSLTTGFNFTAQEKAKLLAFLYTLTDYSFVSNPDF